MASLYEDQDFLEKMEQEEPYDDRIRCDECGEVIDDYYYVIDDFIYCEDCINRHMHKIY